MWLTVFFGGIWQFIRSIFSWKNKTPFWRVIWLVITICVVTVTCMLAYSFHREYFTDRYLRNGMYLGYDLSDRYRFIDNGQGKSSIINKETEKTVLHNLDWIVRSEEGDSLLVFSKNKKRGYFNYYTGEIVLPAQYEAAWVFNNGIAGVCLNDTVFFIDHTGKRVNDLKIKRKPGHSYCYHGDYMALSTQGKVGLVDRKGQWIQKPIYDSMNPQPRNTWIAKLDNKVGLLDSKGELLIPIENEDIKVTPTDGIIVAFSDYTLKRLDYDGSVIDNFVFDSLLFMEYPIDEYDKDGIRKVKPASLLKYATFINGIERYGLIDENGRVITLPLYSSLDAISEDLYEARVADDKVAFILNSKGEKVNG